MSYLKPDAKGSETLTLSRAGTGNAFILNPSSSTFIPVDDTLQPFSVNSAAEVQTPLLTSDKALSLKNLPGFGVENLMVCGPFVLVNSPAFAATPHCVLSSLMYNSYFLILPFSPSDRGK